ncbi:nucleotidyltransferase family protein [uncultured Polaribacter sp.]|uniref:nucleotidyltransferase domain-containing protein n=1 Tax=uncultured Polaribacter sp. TaxID=174711 RepID=UPI00260A9AFA|nr:nucleotidyltransferase family protein [uncultured Polaribacter sp.]
MHNKETLFFIGTILASNKELENINYLEQKLQSKKIDWDSFIKVSTSHFVLPALYINLKRLNFLQYLPSDLVDFMEHITELNRKRNEQIIKQAREINNLLLSNNIAPVFLKGTGNLLEGLYEDIAERMVGDIDFIFSKKDYNKAIDILIDFGYEPVIKQDYYFPYFKHYPRIRKKGSIAAVEIHKELIIKEFSKEFNYNFIQKDIQKFDKIHVLSYQNQLCLSIIATQINDYSFYYKSISLRNAYDILLLSSKINTSTDFSNLNRLKNPLNCYVALCYDIFNKANSLEYNKTSQTKKYLLKFYKLLNNDELRLKHHKRTKRKIFISYRIKIIFESFYNKELRLWLFKRITDKKWLSQKINKFDFKND